MSCDLCDRKCEVVCDNCDSKFCCGLHRRLHCPEDNMCYPFTVRASPAVGRYVVASRFIRAGEVIFEDESLVVGPNPETEPICLSCHKDVKDVLSSATCSGCAYPVCVDCADVPAHSAKECQILASATPLNYQLILPLRLLLLKEENQIHGSCVSGFRGLFPLGSLLSHACVPNVTISYSKLWYQGNHSSTVARYVAAVDVAAGEELTSKYVSALMSTALRRRPKLSTDWFFSCNCKRCTDPTELGSYLGAVVCPVCPKSSQNYLLPVNPLADKSSWSCQSCGEEKSFQSIQELILPLIARINDVAKLNRYDLEAFLGIYKDAELLVHPRNEVICELSKWMLPIMCRGRRSLDNFPREMVKLKKKLAENLQFVLQKVLPGLNKIRGKSLFETLEVSSYLWVTDYNEERMNAKDLSKLCLEMAESDCANIVACLEAEGNLSAYEEWMLNRTKSLAQELDSVAKTVYCQESSLTELRND